MRPRAASQRGGHSLLETLVVISITSVVLGLIATTLHRTMNAYQDAHAFREDETAAWRLSHQMRRDLRSAEYDIAHRDGELRLLLRSRQGEQIEYRFRPRAVVRHQRRGAEQPTIRDQFRFRSPRSWRVETDATGLLIRTEAEAATPFFRLVANDAVANSEGRP